MSSKGEAGHVDEFVFYGEKRNQTLSLPKGEGRVRVELLR
jgi:hypothetical protein